MEPTTDASVAEALNALASPTRLALLRELRSPRIVTEIEVRPPERGDGAPIARQVVRKHLDVLLAAGLVSTRDVVRERGDTVEFYLNHQTIYALAEELRDLARLRPAVEPAESTLMRSRGESAAPAASPSLVVVKGLDEGVAFDLAPRPGRTSWTIGRRRGLEVSLDFDPFVSAENSRVTWSSAAHAIETLPGSRNGTAVNFRPLAPGEVRALRHGDLVSVGRTTLSYWSSP